MYYSQIRVDPKNPEIVYVGVLNFSKSTDGGKTFKSLQPGIAHSDHHAIWINPNNPIFTITPLSTMVTDVGDCS